LRAAERILCDALVFIVAKKGLDSSLERKISQIGILNNVKLLLLSQIIAY